MGMTVGEIARLLGGTVQGDPATEITGVNGLQEAGPGDLVYLHKQAPEQWANDGEVAAEILWLKIG